VTAKEVKKKVIGVLAGSSIPNHLCFSLPDLKLLLLHVPQSSLQLLL